MSEPLRALKLARDPGHDHVLAPPVVLGQTEHHGGGALRPDLIGERELPDSNDLPELEATGHHRPRTHPRRTLEPPGPERRPEAIRADPSPTRRHPEPTRALGSDGQRAGGPELSQGNS